MPDSNADRQRRFRAHKRGDHSLCEPERCREARTDEVAVPVEAPPTPMVAEVSAPGGIEQAVAVFVEALAFKPGDPRAILGTIAVRLAKRVDESGAFPAAVRELRVLLAQISEVPGGPAGPVDEVRVQRAWRRLDALVATAA